MAVELATAYVSIVPSFRGGVGALQKEISGVGATAGKALTDQMAGTVQKETGRTGKLAKAFGGIGGIIAGGFAGGAAISAVADAVGGFISAAEDSQKVAKQTASVLKSTGGAAGVSASQISDLATALSMKSGVDDEVIQSGENVLLTFTKIRNEAGKGNDIFDQTTKVALDMSAALGTDLQGSVIQVGKALQDPIKGISALQRVGVSFTEQQKEQIKTLVESGDTLGAQKLILHELNTEFGGAAAASATASDKMSVAWGNVQEQLGNVLLPIFEKVSTWLAKELPGAIAWSQDAIKTIQAFFDEHRKQFETLGKVLQVLFDYIKIQVKVFVTAVKIEFAVIADIVKFFYNYVYNPLKAAVTTLLNNVIVPTVRTGVAVVKTTWNVMEAIYTFFRDRVYAPIADFATRLKNAVVNAVKGAVDGAKTAWNGLSAIYNWFVTNVYDPVSSVVGRLKDGIRAAFKGAVDGVKSAWDKLADVVKAPINLVIGFYDDGIRWVWNNVISKIPGVGDLPYVNRLATGGLVPGTGNRDTVPALLTPGEGVITKDAMKALGGAAALDRINRLRPGMTADPGVLGYASGGVVRSVQEVQQFASQQAGKPYVFPLVGPNGFDCSGLASAIVNFALGLFPWSRRFSSGTIGSDRALQAGPGDPGRGLTIGAKPPFTTNSLGDLVGHVAMTIAGKNAEATPPAVRVGGAARGSTNGLFTEHYFLPGFGGLTDEEKSVVGWMRMAQGLTLPNLGGPPMGDLLTGAFKGFPHMIYDFLFKKLPGIIKDAIVDVGVQVGQPNTAGAAIGLFKGIGHLFGAANGGTVPYTGPMWVGEHGVPEVVWRNRGEYIESLTNPEHVAARGAPLIGTLVNNRRDLTPNDLAQMIQIARLTMA